MSLYTPTDQLGQPLNTVYAEDVAQLVNVLTGQRDAGALSLLQALAAPAAPSTVLSAGAVTGTGYQWGVYWITGLMDGTGTPHPTGRTPVGTLTTAQALTSQQATVSISGLTPPTGAIGWGLARNKSAGATWFTVPGSEQFMSVAGTIPSSFVDNTADSLLVTAAPTTNSTGTYLANYGQVVAFGTKSSSVSTTGTTFAAGADLLASALSFTSPGSTSYRLLVRAPSWQSPGTGDQWVMRLNLDGADGGFLTVQNEPTGGYQLGCFAEGVFTPSAGTHTVNARIASAAGSTLTVNAGGGGTSTYLPLLVMLLRLP